MSTSRIASGVPQGGQFAATKRAGADPSVALVDLEQSYAAAKEAAVTYGRHMYNAGRALNNPRLSPSTQRDTAEVIAADADEKLQAAVAAIYGKDSPLLAQARTVIGDYGVDMHNAGKIATDPAYGETSRAAAATTIVTNADRDLYRELPGAPDDDEDDGDGDPTACVSCGNYLPSDNEQVERTCTPCAALNGSGSAGSGEGRALAPHTSGT